MTQFTDTELKEELDALDGMDTITVFMVIGETLDQSFLEVLNSPLGEHLIELTQSNPERATNALRELANREEDLWEGLL